MGGASPTQRKLRRHSRRDRLRQSDESCPGMAGPADGPGALHAPEGADCCAVPCLTHETLLSRLTAGLLTAGARRLSLEKTVRQCAKPRRPSRREYATGLTVASTHGTVTNATAPPNAPSMTPSSAPSGERRGSGDDEHELFDVEDRSMAVELFARRQANAQRTFRRARVCEVIGERNMGWPCWMSHGVSKKSTTPVSRQYSAPTISNPSSATRRSSTAEPCRR